MTEIIDDHVHCRDEEEAEKTTISERLAIAKQAGVVAIFDMPNTKRPVITKQRVLERLALAEQAGSSVFYGTHMGVTTNPEQIQEAIETHAELFPRVVGLKLFAGRSVGNLEVTKEKDQANIYKALAGYKGVLTVHCEKESLMKPELWDPRNPISHCAARPSEAELESIIDQVKFAYDANFQGTLHIAHITTPEAVAYVNSVRNHSTNQMGKLKITCVATPHHLFMCDKMMNEELGIMNKVNPPLRTQEQQRGLLECLRRGEIDWIETDDAAHTSDEKLNPPYMSGIQGLHKWPTVISSLRKKGFSKEQLQDLVYNNARKTFNLKEDFYKHNG